MHRHVRGSAVLLIAVDVLLAGSRQAQRAVRQAAALQTAPQPTTAWQHALTWQAEVSVLQI